tara:strand:- start:196 stop:885 length:690 start_codon:yes stop_codon:yes gene_type:complete
MVNVGVLGPKGFVGSSFVNFFKKKNKVKLYKIDRAFLKNKYLNLKLDYLFHCANTGNKRKVNEDYHNDILNSLKLINEIKKKLSFKKLILLSTISARLENNFYGFNRKIVEDYALKLFENILIIRLPVLLNLKQKRGILWDIINSNKINISKRSLVNPISTLQMSRVVYSKLKLNGIVEIGSDKSITLGEIAKIINSKSDFSGNKFNLLSNNHCKNAKIEYLIKQIKNF